MVGFCTYTEGKAATFGNGLEMEYVRKKELKGGLSSQKVGVAVHWDGKAAGEEGVGGG